MSIRGRALVRAKPAEAHDESMFSTLTILTALAALTGPAPQGSTAPSAAPQQAARQQVVRASGEESVVGGRSYAGQGVEVAASEASLQPTPIPQDETAPTTVEPRRAEPPPRRDLVLLQN